MPRVPASETVPGSPARLSRQPRQEAALLQRRRRWVVVLLVVLALLSPAIYSYTSWMLQPTSLSFSVRSVEWIRSLPGGNWLVDEFEHVYYSWKAPKKPAPS